MKHASMNRIYRLVWNAALGVWVAVAETAKGRGKGGSARKSVAVLASLLALLSPHSHAADAANAAVVAGTGSVTTAGSVAKTTTINQTSQRLAIDWTKLSTTANEALVFKQPNASSIALNRVTGTDASQLLGSLSANGQVFVLNPNGILFGATSQVNVGGLVASTLGLSNDDFMNGKYSFANNGASGSVVNQGSITAANGGYLALLAPEVRNEGVMTATLGTALLAAGNKVTLKLDNGSLLGYSIDQGAVKALAENGGLIKADGGQVLLTATALDALTTASVNNTGMIEAQTVQNKAGRIVLLGDKSTGTVNVAGKLDASAPNGGDGGFIETSAANVRIADSATITTLAKSGRTGSWLIDPQTWTITDGGADINVGPDNYTSNTTLVAQLANTNVTIQTDPGNTTITVNGPVSWTAPTTLTLNAGSTLQINAPVSFANGGLDLSATGYSVFVPDASGGGGTTYLSYGYINAAADITGKTLTVRTGQWNQVGSNLPKLAVEDFRYGGDVFIRALGGQGDSAYPFQIVDVYGLQGMGYNQNGSSFSLRNFVLARDIDASGTAKWNNDGVTAAGFKPIETVLSLSGAGHTITGLTINRPQEDNVGMFANLQYGASIDGLSLRDVSITGRTNVGGIAANHISGLIQNSDVTGVVRGATNVGGLIGATYGGSLTHVNTSGAVTGATQVGGIVGQSNGAPLSDSFSTAVVTGNGEVGGLVGLLNGGTITNSFASGAVNGLSSVGGLAGTLNGATIVNSHASGGVTGSAAVGGLGGTVTGATTTTITNSDANGLVLAPAGQGGGLIASNQGSLNATGSAWDIQTTGQATSAGGFGVSSITPTNGYANVVAGTGTIRRTADTTLIDQTSQNLVIDWTRLSTNANESLVFRQPGASSIALNRVTGSDPSELLGSLSANGQVFIINPNGVLFGARSRVNVGGLVASTMSLSNSDFMGGIYGFANTGTSASVLNQGSLLAAPGGYLALLAPDAENEGSMTANLGRVLMAGANQVSLSLASGSMTGYAVGQGASNALAKNSGSITANGGQAVMTAKALDAGTVGTVTNTGSGVIQAHAVTGQTGSILLKTETAGNTLPGVINIDGTLDATSPYGGGGGTVSLQGGTLNQQASARIITGAESGPGTLLMNLSSFTINNGGAASGAGFYSNTYLDSLLASANVTISTSTGSGLITVNGAVDWTSNASLRLLAGCGASNIDINAPISFANGGLQLSATGNINVNAAVTGKTLTLESGKWSQVASALPALAVDDFRIAGGTFIRALGGDGGATPYQLADIYGVQGMGSAGLGNASFVLANDIDANGTARWNDSGVTAAGFKPIVAASQTLDGAGHTISGLTINRPAEDNVGLYGSTGGGTIDKISLVNASVTGRDNTGALVGAASGNITNSHATGVVSGQQSVGGLVGSGSNDFSLVTIAGSDTNVTVSGVGNVGGLIGYAYGGNLDGNHADGPVRGAGNVGGLVGYVGQSIVTNNYATGVVDGAANVGGLVGHIDDGSYVTGNHASGAVTGTNNVGGLAGQVSYDALVGSSSATGSVIGVTQVGGLAGSASQATINTSYATGSVSGTNNVGGLAGQVDNTLMEDDYAAAAVHGVNVVGGLIGAYSDSGFGLSQNFYASGSVTGSTKVGGLIGSNNGFIQLSYANGRVLAPVGQGGGLIAVNTGTVNASVWDIQATGQATSAGACSSICNNYDGVSTAQMMQAATFINHGWSIASSGSQPGHWRIYEGHTAPLLRSFLTPLALTDATATYNAQVQSTATAVDKPELLGTASGINVGTYYGDSSRYYSTQQGYDLSGTANLIIEKASIRVGTGDVVKTYDGGLSALGTAAVVGGSLFGSDSLAGGSFAFTDKNAGIGNKTVTTSGVTVNDGNGGLNYSVTYADNTTSTITRAGLALRANNVVKTYDGGLTVTGGTAQVIGGTLASGDSVSGGSFAFTDKNAGTSNKTVTTTGVTVGDGVNNANYVVSYVDNTTSTINQAVLNVTTTGVDKVYDGNRNAGVTYGSDKVAGDVLNFSNTSSTFAGKNVGTGISIHVAGISASGADAGNYVLASNTSSTSANITARTLNVSTTGVNKVYDGTTAATVTYGSDQVAGDVLNFSNTSSTFAGKNVGTGVVISVSGISASGTDAGNYVLASNTSSTSADIAARTLNVFTTGVNKVYDGTTAATVTYGSDKVAGDVLNFSNTSSNFAGKNVGTGVAINVAGINASGADAGNYVLASNSSSTSANITARTLNISTTGVDKVYDGTTATTVTYGSDKVAGDVLSFSNISSTFAGKNVGTGVAISVAGISASGTDAGNYVLASNASSTSANITARTLNISTTGVDKVYDGNTNAVVTYGSDKIAGDVLNFSNTSSTFAGKNVGTGVAISVAGISASGADAGNYVLSSNASSTSANITARTLNVSTTGVDKVYDGTTAATVTYGSDKVAGDVLNFSNTSSTFAGKNVGTGVAISVAGISASGADAGNYVLASNASTTSANIAARTLNVSTTGVDKVYDGNTNAVVSYGSDKVAGDMLSFSNTASTFASKNVGTGIGISVTGISASGVDAGNYVLAGTTSSTSANITPRTLNVTTTGVDKVYDGSTNAVVTYGSDKVAGDALSFSNTASNFASRNVGTGIAISVAGLSASGADAGNYVLASSNSGTSANITPKALTVTANNDQKAFTGAPYSGGNGVSYSGFVAGDSAANITGTPVYSGSSQGAFQIGAYLITPGGLSAQWGNYALGYSSGTLLITPTAYLNFQGLWSLLNPYDCKLQAVKGFGGTQGAGSAGCSTLSTPESMAAQLAATAADNAQ
jgi:filamentous hemagglutinin family protein